MSEVNETNDQAVDALGMSDEDFADLTPEQFEAQFEGQSDEGGEPGQEDAGTTDEDLDPENDAESEDGDAGPEAEADYSEDDGDGEGTDAEDGGAEEGDESDNSEATDEESEGGSEEEDGEKEESEEDSDDLDYKAEYERLMAPFKANGKEMKVSNIDEVRQLMQMGANYNKKMAALKPSLKTMKLLEKNELLDEGKLGYLIDLHKGDKGAIQKLVKDSGIDPLEMDVESESDYKPETYTVDDRELELDEVLERLQDTPSYPETINVVSNKWDEQSRQQISNDPTVLEQLNTHVANGVYERVSAEVEKERTFGRLNGLSDLEAYHRVGHALSEKGALNDLVKPAPAATNQSAEDAPAKKVVAKGKTKQDAKLKQKKRAASSTRSKPAKKEPEFNPLSLSDDEFEKAVNENLL